MAKQANAKTAVAKAGGVVAKGRAAKAALRARGEALISEAVALKARISKDFWELGRRLMTMRDEEVHAALGYDRVDDLIAERVGIAATVAWKLIAVAEQLPRAEAVKLGQEKAYALVTLARATHVADSAAELAAADIDVGGKPLSQASLREVQAAVAAARPKRPPTLAELKRASAERALVKALQARLDGLGLPKRKVELDGDTVVLRLTRKQAERLLAK